VKHEYKQRAVTLEDIGRELVKGESLEVQLAMSALIAKAKQVAMKQQEQHASVAQMGVVDHERGWRLVAEG
jgi:hypothetical protein